MISKEKLDKILTTHKAQPVGDGYIDIIVRGEHIRPFIAQLLQSDVEISHISWWEYVAPETESKFGQGGPSSVYFDGMFAEIWLSTHELHSSDLEEIMGVIENRVIKFASGAQITFTKDGILTPALWLKVPEHWKSR